MPNLLYHKNSVIGRLYNYFFVYFQNLGSCTAENLFLFIIAIIAMEAAPSVRFLYRHFISNITEKSLNAFYYLCSYAKIDYSNFMNITASLALDLITDFYKSEPVFLCIDDTMISKFGQKFENISKLFDHAAHSGSNYLNGHCFVSLMLCVPVSLKNKIHYCAVPLGYRMWKKDMSKLQLARSMVNKVMPTLSNVDQVFLLFDSWYAKKDLTGVVSEYPNLDIICNVRCDSVIYDLPPEKTGKRGRPAKHGKKLSLINDFMLSENKIGDYFIGYKEVLTNLFDNLPVTAYVTAVNKNSSVRRLFLSTVDPCNIRIACAWQEKAPLNQTGKEYMPYVPLFLYSFRWNIEVCYYEQKTFWSLCAYMLRSSRAIKLFVNLVNIVYCAMKILPYTDDMFSQYKNISVQETRLEISRKIQEQVFIASFVNSLETPLKSNPIVELLKSKIFSNAS